MLPIVAVIPSRYEPARLDRLLANIWREVRRVVVIDTGHEPPFTSRLPNVSVIRVTPERGIYHWWNIGWQEAREIVRGPMNVAVLNDDIVIQPGSLTFLASALRSDDSIGAVSPDPRYRPPARLPSQVSLVVDRDPTTGRMITGFCFVFRGELSLPPFDEGYHWWYGDSQFDETLRLLGYGVARVEGVPIGHVSDAQTNNWARRPELLEVIERDGARWAELHKEIRDGRWYPYAETVRG